jgi:hypothetical protein
MRDLLISLYERFHDPQSPIYEDRIYVPLGISLILATLAIAIVFYFFLNGFRARFNKWSHWLFCLILNCIIGFLAPILIVASLGGDQASAFSSDTLVLCLINSSYSFLFFIVVSMVLKWGSPHASRTPI